MKSKPQYSSKSWMRKAQAVLFCCLLAPFANAQQPKQPAPDKTLKTKASEWLRDDHTGFVENKGQIRDQDGKANPAIKYLLNMPGLNVQLRSTGFSYDAWVMEKTGKKITQTGPDGKDSHKDESVQKFHRVDISLEGANTDAPLLAEKPLTATENIFSELGQFENIHSYRKVTYKDIYPGIDLEFVAKKGTDKPVEYNFIVHPGADASKIKMQYNSGSDIALENGRIRMKLAFGTLEEKIPASFTQQDGQSLAVQYKPLDEDLDLYAFNVPAYDKSQTLVIDPTPSLVWSTYYGGTTGATNISTIATGDAGNIYIVGFTGATGMATAGAHQTSINASASQNAILAKFSASGQRIWATYYGGTVNGETGTGLGYDPSGFIYMVGQAYSPNASGANTSVIATPGAIQSAPIGNNSWLIVKFNTAGVRQWGTYFAGTAGNIDQASQVAIGKNGSVYISGRVYGTGYATAGAFQTLLNSNGTGAGTNADGFILKLYSSGAKAWATYFGGTGTDVFDGLALDGRDNIYLTGTTRSTTSIAANVSEGQTPFVTPDVVAGMVAKFDSSGSRQWARYYGASTSTNQSGIKYDPANNALYIVGTVASTSDVSTTGAFQTALSGTSDVYLARLDTNGVRVWGTYIGGAGAETNSGLGIDANGNPYVYALTTSTNVIATNCTYQAANGGSTDIMLEKFSPSGTRIWGTYLGAAGGETINARQSNPVAIATDGSIYTIGLTLASTASIVTAGAFQTTTPTTLSGLISKFTEGYLPVDFKAAASTIAPLTQSACALGIPQTIVGNTVTVINPNNFTSGIFYQWQQATTATGPWTDLTGESFKDLTPPTGSGPFFYRRLVKANNGYCDLSVVDSSAVASVTINGNISPIANADGPAWYLCSGNSISLTGSGTGQGGATISSYAWYTGSATTTSATTAAFAPTNITAGTTYTLKVTDNNGCSGLDQVTVTPVVANAGPAVSYCVGGAGVQIGTTPVMSPKVKYSWSPTTDLSNPLIAQPIASPSATRTYTLTVTVTKKDNTTCTSTSTVTVTRVASPAANFAGTDKTICKNGTTTLGVTNAAFTYTWTPGTYLNSTVANTPTFTPGTGAVPCPMTYTVTAAASGCTFEDRVDVSVIDPTISSEGQTFCGPGWVNGTGTNCAATYTWNLTSAVGTGQVVSTRNSGADAYLKNLGAPGGPAATFTRTTTVNGVPCTSGTVTVNNCTTGSGCSSVTIKQLSAQGCPKAFAGQPLQLTVNGITTADYNISWTPATIMDNPTAATVNIVNTTQTTVTVTVTNKYDGSVCSANLLINNGTWALPVGNIVDKNTCPSVGVNVGVAPVSGYTYTWTPAANLSNSTISNPTATLTTTTAYSVLIKETATGCQVKKDMNVNVRTVDFDAGPDRAVCNNGTVTLGTTAPVGSNYSYAWTPANGAWQNGTGPTNANPQVLFAGADQTYTVTATDPLTGCTKVDAVTLMGAVTPGTYAGAASPPAVCPGGTSQLGGTAMTGANYLWSPAASLSCTTCANPVATPTSTTTYTVAVSYAGCSTPVTDNVTVTVNATTPFDFVNKTICPATPTNIGVGGTGNPASIANAASYSWSPSTGLSCTTCASPNANPQVATTYTCTITFTNGCTRSDDVTITPTFVASAKPDATICTGTSVVLGLPSVAGVTYSWSPATSLSATNVAQPTFTAGVTGTYTLTATLGACVLTDAVRVTVVSPPAFTLSGNQTLCTGGTTTLSASATVANMLYQWAPTTGVTSPNSTTTDVTPTATTKYKLVQTDLQSGCSNFQEIRVIVNTNPITATGGTANVCTNNGTSLPLTTNGTYTYSWLPTAQLSSPFVKNPTSYASSTTSYTVTITDNVSNCQLTAQTTLNTGVCSVSVSGNVFHDANGQTDNTVNGTNPASTLPTGIYVSLVDAHNNIIATVSLNNDGSYSFGVVPAGTYSVVLTSSPAGSNTPVMPSGWQGTGAFLGTGPGTAGNLGILPNIVVGTSDVTNANFGIQYPPVTADSTMAKSVNPGGTATVDITNSFINSDVDGTVSTITLLAFPTNVNTVTVNGQVYVPTGVTPGPGQLAWPPTGGVTVPKAGFSVLIDPVDGNVTSSIPFQVTDNGGATSNASTLNKPFESYPLSGNVLHDANGLTDNTVNASGSVATIPAGLYATLVDGNNNILKTVPVQANGSYDFGETAVGNYSIVLSQSSTGSLTPALPSGWQNTGENLGAGAANDNTVNGILTNVAVVNAAVTNANFGIQQPPVSDSKTYIIPQPTGHAQLPLTGTGAANSPGPLSGSDAEDGTKATGATFTVTDTTGMNGNELFYNGTKIVPGTSIPNYDPSLLSVHFSSSGSTSLVFNYAVTDNAGTKSPAAPYSISWATPLPVTLLSFEAAKAGHTALLTWKTANEQNSDYFIAERSTDAQVWNEAGRVKATGTVNGQSYSLSDEHPAKGTNYYRLRMMDKSGSYTLSMTRKLVFDEAGDVIKVTLSPNPAESNAKLKFSRALASTVFVKVWSNTGLLLSTQTLQQGTQEYGLDLSNLARGLYLVQVVGDGLNEQLKLMLK